ncbi:MAG: PEGA domain-containing protein [Candidatus Ratteibacteria bacterium]|nr:PEGA domain-containing protein [Candidatus Ratteibacteria bacterium]
MSKLKFWLVLVLIALIPFASAAGQVTVVKRELIDNQYGIFTSVLGIGNQIYKVTYSDGTTAEVSISGKTLSLGAITEIPSGTNIDTSVCYNAKTNVRVKTIQDSANSFTDTHRIEVWENDLGGSVDLLLANFPTNKVYDSNQFQSSSTISTPYSIEIPYRGYTAGQTIPFMVVEYQMKKDGTWVRLANPGWGVTSTYMLNIIWYNSYQSGAGRGALTGGNCKYPVPQPTVAATPTPIPVSTKTIQVISSPSGATVTSSGQTLGTTPFSLSLDSSSAKILTFTLAGYTSVAKGVDINTASPVSAVFISASPTPAIGAITPTQTPTPVPTMGTPNEPAPTSTASGETGSAIVETEIPSGGAVITYEKESILTSTNILIAIIAIAIVYIGYTKLHIKEGKSKGKSKGKKRT